MMIANRYTSTARPWWAFPLALVVATCTHSPAEKPQPAAAATASPDPGTVGSPGPTGSPRARSSEATAVAPAPFRPEEDLSVRLQKEIESAAKADPESVARLSALRPVLTCVEKTGSSQWRAHFGYKNRAAREITVGTGLHNRLWPPPIAKGQPTAFSPGSRTDALELPFTEGTSVAWVLGQSFDLATTSSPACRTAGAKARGTHARAR
jgi:hypothetical protein